jgi:hypothetical protein
MAETRTVRPVTRAMVTVRMVVMFTAFHHPHHFRAAGPEKYDCQYDEDSAGAVAAKEPGP